ncbi:hypothetical protein SAMN05445504_4180 [Burkholderia sp. CF099]|nr:hypothetical protein SAMN05445504_4180 [Burkholderia sp. CF099]
MCVSVLHLQNDYVRRACDIFLDINTARTAAHSNRAAVESGAKPVALRTRIRMFTALDAPKREATYDARST